MCTGNTGKKGKKEIEEKELNFSKFNQGPARVVGPRNAKGSKREKDFGNPREPFWGGERKIRLHERRLSRQVVRTFGF